MGNGIKLLLMIFVGFLFIMVGARGQLGSMLGALLVPQYMAGPAQATYDANQVAQLTIPILSTALGG